MKKKRFLLVSIILIPGLIYYIFELTHANFKKMAYYGTKTFSTKGDTVYYSVPDVYFITNFITHPHMITTEDGDKVETLVGKWDSLSIDSINYPVYVILFLDSKLKGEGYKLRALYDYVQFKSQEFKDVPIFFISNFNAAVGLVNDTNKIIRGDFDSLKINLPNFHPLLVGDNKAKEAYFTKKPYYVFDYFAVLVDKHRHIRGYYDPNQNSEVKRLLQEYKHLKTKDEYANTLKQNELEKK
ncbi:MAG: hypothetical protein ACYDCN_11415 [Bacteroidia bacterium]